MIVEPAIAVELVQIRVLVGKTLEPGIAPECEVVRWFPNPEYAPAAPAPAAAAAP